MLKQTTSIPKLESVNVMKRAIVTGASGFVGSRLVGELVSKGVEVIAVVRSDKSDLTELVKYENVKIVFCSLEKILHLTTIIDSRDFDVFYHFAWSGTSGNDRSNAQLQISNIQSTCDAIYVSKELECKKFVNAGSITEYEVMKYLSIDGTTPAQSSLYSIAKLAADFMAKTLSIKLGIDYINAVISNIYGPGEKSSRFVNTTIRKFLNHETVSFTLGTQLYDFIYITDAVKSLYLVGEFGRANHIYYIGNINPLPLKEFVIRIRDIVDKDIVIEFGSIPFSGTTLSYDEFDNQRLKKEFDFDCLVSFDEGIKKTLEWIHKIDNKTISSRTKMEQKR